MGREVLKELVSYASWNCWLAWHGWFCFNSTNVARGDFNFFETRFFSTSNAGDKVPEKIKFKGSLILLMPLTKVLWLIVMLFSRVRGLNTEGKCFLHFGRKAGVEFGLMLRGNLEWKKKQRLVWIQ